MINKPSSIHQNAPQTSQDRFQATLPTMDRFVLAKYRLKTKRFDFTDKRSDRYQ